MEVAINEERCIGSHVLIVLDDDGDDISTIAISFATLDGDPAGSITVCTEVVLFAIAHSPTVERRLGGASLDSLRARHGYSL